MPILYIPLITEPLDARSASASVYIFLYTFHIIISYIIMCLCFFYLKSKISGNNWYTGGIFEYAL